LLQKLLASLASPELFFPFVDDSVHLLNLSDDDGHILRHFNIKSLKFASSFENLDIEAFHLAGKSRAKLVQDIVVDLVVLVVDLSLNCVVANLETSKENEILSCLKSSSALIYFIKQLIPLVNLRSKFFVDVFLLLLNIPKRLVVSPGVHVSGSFDKDFLKLDVDRADVESLAHLVE